MLDDAHSACPPPAGFRDGSRRMYGASAGRTSLAVLIACAVLLLGAAAWFTRTPATRTDGSALLGDSERTAPDSPSTSNPDATDHVTSERDEHAAKVDERTTAVPEPEVARDLLRLLLQDDSAQALTGVFDVEYAAVKSNAPAKSGVVRSARENGPLVQIEVERTGSYEVHVVGTDRRGEFVEGRETVVAQRGQDDPATPFVLRVSRRIFGIIVDADQNPMESVPVSVLAHFGSDRPHRATTSTDAAGQFVLWSPAEKAARLFIGDPELPWIPPIEIGAGGRQLALDPIRLDLHEATFVVQRADGTPVPMAEIIGTGLDGGRFEARTDGSGRARVQHMPRGRWRVNAALEPHGRENRAVDIPLASDAPVVIVLPR